MVPSPDPVKCKGVGLHHGLVGGFLSLSGYLEIVALWTSELKIADSEGNTTYPHGFVQFRPTDLTHHHHINRLSTEKANVTSLTNTLAERDTQVATLQQSISDQKDAHEKQLAQVEEKCQEQVSQIQSQLDSERTENGRKMAELNERIDGLCKDVENLKDTVARKDKEIVDIAQAKDNIIADLNRQVAASETTVKGIMFMRHNVDAFHLQSDHITEPVAACILPDGCILVADTMQGLLLFSPHTELVQKCASAEQNWKWPQGLCYDATNGRVLVTCMKRKSDGSFRRAIQCFVVQPDELHLYHQLAEAETIECPEDAQVDTHLAKERLALSAQGDIYMALADNLGSALYKHHSGGWDCLSKRQGQVFSDLAVLQGDAAITEVLLVESKMGYLHKFSVRGRDVAQRSSIACVEKPACLAVDENNTVFIQDVITGKVHRLNQRFEVEADVCLIDDSVFSVTASHGCLGVALREQKTVRIYRYGAFKEGSAKPQALSAATTPITS